MSNIPKTAKWIAKFFPPARKKILEKIYFEIKKGYRAPVTEITKMDMEFKDLVKTKEFVVYFHFPFCKSACKYCTFRKNFDKELIDQYCESVLHEIEWIGESRSFTNNTFNSVYFGGGTPSLIPKKYLEKITKYMMKFFSNGYIPQISLEGSPENLDVSKENLDFYREIGINRISIGAQSFHNEVLEEMRRNHKSEKTISVIEGLNKEDFDFNIDLMYGFDCQSIDMFINDVHKGIDLNVPHISLYPLARAGKRGSHTRDKSMEKKQQAQYVAARELLLTNGYIQYTTDNFYQKETAKCKYLEATWKGPLKDTLTLGASGFGWADEFYSKPFDVKKYIECIENKIEPFLIMNLTTEEKFYGRAFFGLHGISIDRDKFKERNGRDLAECELIKVLQSLNMLRIEKSEVRLTEDGLYRYTELWGRATFLELMDEQQIV